MPAGVVEGRDGAVVLAQDENRIRADLVGLVVARLGNLGFAGYEQPVAREDVLEVGGVDPLVTEERAGERIPRAAGVQEGRDGIAGIEVVHVRKDYTSPRSDPVKFP